MCNRDQDSQNLYVVPYIRGRLAFAQLVAKIMEEETFDRVIIDLPQFVGETGALTTALRLFPLVSSLIVRRENKSFALLPFVPTDAPCIAALLAGMKSTGVECIDDSSLIDYPEGQLFQPDQIPMDDYFVLSEGLEKFFSTAWAQMDSLWDKAPSMQRNYTLLRAARLTERLQRTLQQKKKILFVCEYHLWWAVRRQLWKNMDGSTDPLPKTMQETHSAAIILEDPCLLWARGLFDDYPSINLEFYQRLLRGELASFDKLCLLESVLTCSASSPEKLREAGNPSVRLLITLKRYLSTRVSASRRVTPLPVEHLLDSAHSCVGKEFAGGLARELLQYPLPPVSADAHANLAYLETSSNNIAGGPDFFDVPDVFHCDLYYERSGAEMVSFLLQKEEEYRLRWVDFVHPHVTRQESIDMGENAGCVRWAVKQDYDFHELICRGLRDAVKRQCSTVRVQRSWGNLKDGVHWKATLGSMARGEGAIYVKARLHHRPQFRRFDEHTPIVFLFEKDISLEGSLPVHDSNPVLRSSQLGNSHFSSEKKGAPDQFYSVFVTKSGTEMLWGSDVQKDTLTSITFLLTRFSAGLERYASISRRSAAYQCRVPPAEDEELNSFAPSECMLAWAIKYASEAVIVAAYAGWMPSEKVIRFAKLRGIDLISVPLSVLAPDAIQRLRRMYFTSTRLKRYSGGEKIVKRFVQ